MSTLPGNTAALTCPLTRAPPASSPDPHDWLTWQVDQHARVAGINGRVDLDIMKFPIASGTGLGRSW
jgi:GH25 family lysozyme M1 (1,4-beta-N-acetylmuramidase)